MGSLLAQLIQLYMAVLLVRVVASWIPPSGQGLWATVAGYAYDLTEPVLAPIRRILPATGMIDLSVMVLFFLLQFLTAIVRPL